MNIEIVIRVTYELYELSLLDLDPEIFNIRKLITPILQFRSIGKSNLPVPVL